MAGDGGSTSNSICPPSVLCFVGRLLTARTLERLCLAAAVVLAFAPLRAFAAIPLLIAFLVRMENPLPGQGVGQPAPPLPETCRAVSPHTSPFGGRALEMDVRHVHVLIFIGGHLDSGVLRALPRVQKMWATCRSDARVRFLLISRAPEEALTRLAARAGKAGLPIAVDESGGARLFPSVWRSASPARRALAPPARSISERCVLSGAASHQPPSDTQLPSDCSLSPAEATSAYMGRFLGHLLLRPVPHAFVLHGGPSAGTATPTGGSLGAPSARRYVARRVREARRVAQPWARRRLGTGVQRETRKWGRRRSHGRDGAGQ